MPPGPAGTWVDAHEWWAEAQRGCPRRGVASPSCLVTPNLSIALPGGGSVPEIHPFEKGVFSVLLFDAENGLLLLALSLQLGFPLLPIVRE